MMNAAQPQTYYNNLFGDDNDDLQDEGQERVADYRSTLENFRKFIREFSAGGFSYNYCEELKKNYQLDEYFLEIDFADLKQYNEESAMKLKNSPTQYISVVEAAAKEVADTITAPRPEAEKTVQDIQIILTLSSEPTSVRRMKSTDVPKLVKISGIIVAASQVRSRAVKVALQCRTCRNTISNVEVKAGMEIFQLFRQCNANQAGNGQRCPLDPYHIFPDKCVCTDFQTLKLQETPEDVPQGEMPRHMQLYIDRYLSDRVVPGNRVTITGIRMPYIKVTGFHVEMSGAGRSYQWHFSPEDERQFHEIAKRGDVYELITKSIASSIYGSEDIKNTISCLLFDGSRKRLPDRLTRRGDNNVLLLGDPGSAKSQLLKFVEKVSTIAVYTSGKGSSAAGNTLAIIRDPHSRSFILEGGEMVLADGGVVCMDNLNRIQRPTLFCFLGVIHMLAFGGECLEDDIHAKLPSSIIPQDPSKKAAPIFMKEKRELPSKNTVRPFVYFADVGKDHESEELPQIGKGMLLFDEPVEGIFDNAIYGRPLKVMEWCAKYNVFAIFMENLETKSGFLAPNVIRKQMQKKGLKVPTTDDEVFVFLSNVNEVKASIQKINFLSSDALKAVTDAVERYFDVNE